MRGLSAWLNPGKRLYITSATLYGLVAIVKKRLKLDRSLYTILQIVSVTLFENTLIFQALSPFDDDEPKAEDNRDTSHFFIYNKGDGSIYLICISAVT